MATLHNLLDQALEDGLLCAESVEKPYFHRSVRTCSKILVLLEMSDQRGLTIAALCQHVGITAQTARIYTRWLEDKGLILIEEEGPMNVLYLRGKQ